MIYRTLLALPLVLSASLAQAATYNIGWVGASDITLSGSFSFDDSLLGTGAIDETDIDALSFDVFDNGSLVGSSNLAASLTAASFNFNFDTSAEQFLVGGNTFTSTFGQVWGSASTIRFGSGDVGQGVENAARGLFGVINVSDSTLTATRVELSEVPLPAGMPLLGIGIVALGWLRRRVTT